MNSPAVCEVELGGLVRCCGSHNTGAFILNLKDLLKCPHKPSADLHFRLSVETMKLLQTLELENYAQMRPVESSMGYAHTLQLDFVQDAHSGTFKEMSSFSLLKRNAELVLVQSGYKETVSGEDFDAAVDILTTVLAEHALGYCVFTNDASISEVRALQHNELHAAAPSAEIALAFEGMYSALCVCDCGTERPDWREVLQPASETRHLQEFVYLQTRVRLQLLQLSKAGTGASQPCVSELEMVGTATEEQHEWPGARKRFTDNDLLRYQLESIREEKNKMDIKIRKMGLEMGEMEDKLVIAASRLKRQAANNQVNVDSAVASSLAQLSASQVELSMAKDALVLSLQFLSAEGAERLQEASRSAEVGDALLYLIGHASQLPVIEVEETTGSDGAQQPQQ